MANNAPTEILENICQHLPFAELKQARLLCRSFNPAARRYVFRAVHVNFDLESFRKLSFISRQPDLSRWVHTLHLNDKIVGNIILGYQKWSTRVFDEKIPIAGSPGRFCDSLLPAELQWHYSQYRYQVESEGRVLTSSLAADWLGDACKSFSALSHITYGSYGGNRYGNFKSQPPTAAGLRHERLSPIVQRTLMERRCSIYARDTKKLFIGMIEAADAARVCLKTIQAFEVPLEAFEDGQSLILYKPDGMISKLRHLRLDIIYENPRLPGFSNHVDYFAKFLCNTIMLQTLHLKLEAFSVHDQRYTLSNLITYREHFPSLNDLNLNQLSTTEVTLVRFLGNHANTLRYLELANMNIVLPPPPTITPAAAAIAAVSPPQPPPPADTNTTSSWPTIINFLAKSLNLRRVSFEGHLSSPPGNGRPAARSATTKAKFWTDLSCGICRGLRCF